MKYLDSLANAIENAGHEVFWQGGASPDQVSKLEELLQVRLPPSFKKFLEEYGGGGVVNAEISGIEDNDAENDAGGTVWGDTLVCRREYLLPPELVVIYFHDNEVCWCLNTKAELGGDCSVVSFNVFKKAIDRIIAPDFQSFLVEHLSLYAEAP